MASRSEDVGGTAMVRQSSSSSCASQASSRSSLSNMGAALAAKAPDIRVMRTQLNFFMARILFMQEENADSLGARTTTARRMNNSASNMAGSNSSLNFNNSASRGLNEGHDDNGGGGLLGHIMEPDNEDMSDDICVFNDNARILPNSVAKSMPTIPSPPAAPESPRPVETKDGIIIMEPTHRPASPKCHTKEDATMPEALPLTDMSLHDSQPALEDVEDSDDDDAQKPEAAKTKPRRSKLETSKRSSVPAVPAEQRIFPKNQRRSVKRGLRESLKRSQSEVANKGGSDLNDLSNSCH